MERPCHPERQRGICSGRCAVAVPPWPFGNGELQIPRFARDDEPLSLSTFPSHSLQRRLIHECAQYETSYR
jgi:hypothetical protein